MGAGVHDGFETEGGDSIGVVALVAHLQRDFDRQIDRVPALGARAAHIKQMLRDKLVEHKTYIYEHGVDMPEIRDWRWGTS